MNDRTTISEEEIDGLLNRLKCEAENAGYHLNPDEEFTRALVESILVNERRYGYWACPCRLADGVREQDLDIICPCDYRDADLDEYGACYCGLYVSADVAAGKREVKPIPERRPPGGPGDTTAPAAHLAGGAGLAYPVWRCKVCGYLCARNAPPGECPVCKAAKDRFELFIGT